MADLSLTWPSSGDSTSGDYQVGPDGDLLVVAGPGETVQRIVRRLLTNPRAKDPSTNQTLPPDDPFNPTYGAGAGRFLGKRAVQGFAQLIKGLVQGVFAAEPGVLRQPPPTVSVTTILGGFAVNVSYTDAATQQRVALPTQNVTQT